ncbi:MAG: UDP-N-acetylmuramoylalanyl-D-glutamyl-2,6-diaminopimelate--D-alanyl-D-alanine ligase [Alphaproteobacteria bacterium]|nr:UDP-N-acetylmuramoylalanyl-D-glutamyl-2,6-diaminopimelate--D-alanyl-D-alanine ligase [Alphaproteobacteria bacterium]
MNTLWTSAEAESATLGQASHSFVVTGLSLNSRTLKPGDLYVAIKGETRDGHDFVHAAFEAKAGAALVSRRPDGVADDAPLLMVANTQRALEDLARAARARSDAKIIAVTGSAGKTTTKEMLKLAFGALGPTHVSGASFNNHWGVPLSMASLSREVAFGVFEIGMNHFGEIRSLVSIVRPHVALITTVAPAHLEFFGNTESIADAKSEIFESIVPGGAALIPSDNPYAERLLARARQFHVGRVLTFGAEPGSDARLLSYEESGEGARVKADVLGRPVDFRIGAPGRHIATNALGGLLSVAAADGDVLNAAAALKTFAALKGRGARFRAGAVDVIDESYNANPASMTAALALLGQSQGRRIAVLGDMLEMGADARTHHAGLTDAIGAARVDLVFLCGPLMKALWDALPMERRAVYAPTSAELVAGLMSALREGDTVLVKGSNGIRMSVIVDALKARAG